MNIYRFICLSISFSYLNLILQLVSFEIEPVRHCSFLIVRYVLKKRIGRGSYGEAWLGFHWNCHKGSNASSPAGKNENRRKSEKGTTHDCNIDPDDNLFVLKRIMVERGAAVYLSGLREKYFGEVFLNASRYLDGLISDGNIASQDEWESSFDELLETNESIHGLAKSWNFEHVLLNKFRLQRAASEGGLNHIARYVESFESRSKELWLVFRHEGLSLSKLMYTAEEIENTGAEEKNEEVKKVHVLHPSKWWRWLKTTEAGKEEMRNLIWQLLIALKSCHDRYINHRDIKPANLVICFEDLETGGCRKGGPSGYNYTTKMRIIDFGSAMDEFSLKHFYESTGPSRAEQTYDYAPPEALLNASWYKGPEGSNLKYDMWSVGVITLELILGSPNVFQISPLTQVLLDPYIEGWNEDFKKLAYKLKSFMELCILVSGSSSKHHHSMGQVSKCMGFAVCAPTITLESGGSIEC